MKSLKILKGGNQNPYIEEEQTTQWPKEKVQNDKQRSTKQTYLTKDRVTMYIFVLFSLDLIHFDKQHRWCHGNRLRIDFCRPWVPARSGQTKD
jgi:hypothetical protein